MLSTINGSENTPSLCTPVSSVTHTRSQHEELVMCTRGEPSLVRGVRRLEQPLGLQDRVWEKQTEAWYMVSGTLRT